MAQTWSQAKMERSGYDRPEDGWGCKDMVQSGTRQTGVVTITKCPCAALSVSLRCACVLSYVCSCTECVPCTVYMCIVCEVYNERSCYICIRRLVGERCGVFYSVQILTHVVTFPSSS